MNELYLKPRVTVGPDTNEFGLCLDCNQQNTHYDWCKNCNSKRFQRDFNKWTSGNELIDKFIQDVQLKARSWREVLEWISYYRLRNIQFLAQGGFSIVYKAIWLYGYIQGWNSEKQLWERYLDELEDETYENPSQENFQPTLNENENEKTESLSALHKCNLVHGGFHNGNLLLLDHNFAYISDFGLSKPSNKPCNNSNEIYEVIPYIAPEVLRGKPYTKASDIYSFGIVMWEITSDQKIVKVQKIFEDKIIQMIFENTEAEYVELMKKCWDPDPNKRNKRPTAEDLVEFFSEMQKKIDINKVNEFNYYEKFRRIFL
ncbi:kinase-like domain-containing protein [Glomus cerebriforme]|uniref:Kinase-like domain-containing protein n=1 Tax=Glomus cerebriforme TaxID=658196 RepID=A0A397T699_9GLOM|nr:kinase-like domain-containing protein [Glomus cerebriforme]